jgi:trimeric autotransporter adhesin
VTLNNAGNDFSSVSITSGNNVTLADINALDLGSSTVSGALNVTTNGAITQSGPVAVAGATTLSAGTGDITLDNPLNDFSTVGVTSANNVTLRDSNNISLGTSAAGGNFSVTAGGAILDGDASAINITATTASLIAASTIGTAVDPLETNVGTLNASTTSGGIFINEANGITLGDISAGGGNIAISNASGNMTVNALTTTGGGVTLTSFGGAIQDGNGAANNVTAGTLTVSAANGIDLDTTLTALSSASVTGTGSIDISNAGALAVNNATSANGNIALNTTGGNLAINMVTAGGIGTVVLSTTTSGDVTLGTVATPNSVTITSAGRITDTNGVVNNITASTSTLTAAANIGTPGDPIETTVGALNGNATAGGIYINETDTVTLNNILAGGGNVTINNATGDMIIHSITATAGGIDLTTSAGSILDGNGAATNLTAVADSNLRALGGVIGLSTDPIEVNINPGLLGVAATGQIGGVSVHINGTVLPTNMLTLLNSPPGEVIFNSQSANPPPINLPNLISIAAELNSYRVNENDYFTDLLLDVLGDDFFKAQSFQCEMDDSLRQKLAADLCHNDDL